MPRNGKTTAGATRRRRRRPAQPAGQNALDLIIAAATERTTDGMVRDWLVALQERGERVTGRCGVTEIPPATRPRRQW
jgi:hypothetical protein